jgi:hypothetical protein
MDPSLLLNWRRKKTPLFYPVKQELYHGALVAKVIRNVRKKGLHSQALLS